MRGKVKLELNPLDVKPAGTLGESLLSGVVTKVDPQDGPGIFMPLFEMS